MKRGTGIKFAFCVLSMIAVASVFSQAQIPQPFSADVNTVTSHGPAVTGKWYFSPPKMRMDITSTQPGKEKGPFGGKVSMIIDGSAKTSIMLLPQAQMYMEITAGGANDIQGMERLENLSHGGEPCAGESNVTCKKVGTETVNGRSCDKWIVTEKEGSTATAWVDQKLHFPIRLQDQDGTTTNFTNIKEGAQEASLFVIPPGYRKFDASAFAHRK